jgi:hypothetical protein
MRCSSAEQALPGRDGEVREEEEVEEEEKEKEKEKEGLTATLSPPTTILALLCF